MHMHLLLVLLVFHQLLLELLQVLLLQLLSQLMEDGAVDGLRHHGPVQRAKAQEADRKKERKKEELERKETEYYTKSNFK